MKIIRGYSIILVDCFSFLIINKERVEKLHCDIE